MKVIIYTRRFCGFCIAAKKLLEKKRKQFHFILEEINVSSFPEKRKEMIDRAAKGRGGTTFPQIFIGDNHLGDCDRIHDLDAQGKLDQYFKDTE